MEQEVRNDIAPQQGTAQTNFTGFNLSPMLFPLNFGGTSHGTQHMTQLVQPAIQLGFPFNMTHSMNSQLIPAQERHGIRLIPTVMPIVAGFCDLCGKCYDQIALETLGEYLVATEYEGETVKERTIRSRAFIHGFEAALFLFKNAGLSHPSRRDGSVVQQWKEHLKDLITNILNSVKSHFDGIFILRCWLFVSLHWWISF